MAVLSTETITGMWYPSDVRLSPDGTRVAWVAAPYGADGEHDEKAIWVARVDSTEPARRFTYGGADSSPRWSPDGKRLAFLSDRAKRGTAGLYVMAADGGEAAPVVSRERAVSALAWSPDGTRLAFLALDDPDDEDRRRTEERDDPEVFGERWQANHLWVADLASGQATKLGDEARHLVAVEWSPDGTALAVIVRPTPEMDAACDGWISLVVAEDGKASRICAAPVAEALCFASGGERIVFAALHEPNPVSGATVWAVPSDGSRAPMVIGPAAAERACGFDVRTVAGEQRVVIQILEGLDTRLEWCDPSSGEREVLWQASGDIASYDVAPGPVLAVAEHAKRGALEVWVGQPDRRRRISDHHAALADVELGGVEDFYAEAADGLELDGMLIRPPGAGAPPWPMVVLPHGGPYGRSGRQVHVGPLNWGQWLATGGYAVLMPNYRGGAGHGHGFATAARGDMGGAEWGDVLAMVDAAVGRGIADPARLGIGGWSQGGFLSAWAVTQTDRFRAAVVGAGVTDWTMLSLTSDAPSFESALAGSPGFPAESRRIADEHSPLLQAARISTPLLILQGQNDRRIPLSQATALHRALGVLDVPVELVTYPREPHGVRELQHQADILRRVRAWFDRWLVAPARSEES
ncbi:MAG: S9 family peptidase [Acidimicrobiales bacterium]